MNTKTINRNCQECSKEFRADKREVTRGNAIFCSLSCVATHTNRTRLLYRADISNICPQCGRTFITKVATKKYCSKKCKQQFYYSSLEFSNHSKLRKLPCELCGWEETTRDIHHIISPRKGGINDESNVVTLCPNHHRMVHKNLVSQDDLKEIIKNRTMSSSGKTPELDALAGN